MASLVQRRVIAPMCWAWSAAIDVMKWPLWLRRAFVLTLPASALLWLLANIAFMVAISLVAVFERPVEIWRRQGGE